MGYVGLLLCALCLAFAQERTEVLNTEDGFNFPFVVDEDIRVENGISTLYVTFRQRCVYSFVVTTDLEEEATISVAKITSFEKTFSQDYLWTTFGTATAEKGVSETIIDLEGAPLCASTWRLTVENTKAVTWSSVSILADPEVEQAYKKRVPIDCSDVDMYPSECAAASDGALCLDTLFCGCKEDKDCFGNTDFPYCTPEGICDRCTELEPNPTTSNLDHLFCRTRYPGFATQPTTMDSLGNERVAPLNYYREVCVRTPVANSGACQRCNQAPLQPFNLGSSAINNGASGTVHCNKVGPPAGAALNPICIDVAYMSFAAGVPVTTPPASYDPNRRGACGPCNIDKECSAALPLTPVCVKTGTDAGSCRKCAANADCSEATTGGNNCQADGSCRSCTGPTDCGALDGGETPGQITCDVATGICKPMFQCTDNASCNGQGGSNCQADKSCKTCTSNADCGILDGGETAGQQVCNVATGICGICSTNANCVGTTGNNCQASGQCLTCTSNAQCGATLDGGETAGQAICNVPTGICEDACTTNTACANKPGKNCQKTGVCLSCTSDATCGNLDGGEVPNQSLCEVGLGICTTPFTCTDNPSCTTQPGLGTNCQADGTCISCTSNTCGSLDGGEIGGQPNCLSTSRLCVGPCTTNAACVNTQGNNCMKGGACKTCVTNADCNNDGGEVPDQSVCNTATGICEAPCSSNADCAALPGKNCQKDGTCVSCAEPEDCGSTDGGEVPDQPACNAGTGICGPCGGNDECPEETPNCGSDGGCYHCNAPGNRCGADDGPAGGPNDNQAHCDTITGICVDYCTSDDHCEDDCAPYCHLNRGCCVQCLEDDNCPGENWRLDQADYTVCSSNSFTCVKGCSIDDDCESDDKPACSPTTGECVECLFDTHCDDFTSVCASSQTCVECVTDAQCADGQSCSEYACTANPDAASGVVVSLFLVLSSALAVALF